MRGLVLALMLFSTAAAASSELDRCDELYRQHGREMNFRCYGLAAAQRGDWADASRRLERILTLNPGDPRIQWALGYTYQMQGEQRCLALYRSAAEGFQQFGGPEWETLALLDLFYALMSSSLADEAEPVLERAALSAARVGNANLQATVGINQALSASHMGELGRAARILRRIEPVVFSTGTDWMRSTWLSNYGTVMRSMNRGAEAAQAFRRQAELADAQELTLESARAWASLSSAIRREEMRPVAETALERARATGSPELIVTALDQLGLAIGTGPERRRLFEEALALAPRASVGARIDAMIGYAYDLTALEPRDIEGGRAIFDEALALAEKHALYSRIAATHARRATAARFNAWNDPDDPALHAEAISSSLRALDAVEVLRDRQPDARVRARVTSLWVGAYSQLVDLLLGASTGDPSRESYELAFTTLERLRSRILLGEMDASRATSGLGPAEARRQSDLYREIAWSQRRLMAPDLTAEERGRRRRELTALEDRLDELRDRWAATSLKYGQLIAPKPATLSRLESSLDPETAFVSLSSTQRTSVDGIQLWAMVHTVDGTSAYHRSADGELWRALEVFDGLILDREGSEIAGARRFYELLLGEVLAELPPRVDKLVISASGPLAGLPWAALRNPHDESPLIARYSVAVTPSATSWLRWRDAGRPGENALVLVDPELPYVDATSGPWTPNERFAALDAVSRFRALPHARREGHLAVRQLGLSSSYRDGARAAEAFVKGAALDRYGLLHFGAHAVIDDVEPTRSAILLAPGDPGEDGLLQSREIVQLDLDGQVVVLSACRSVGEGALAGEGVLGLARSFFVAGSSAVIGSLWPLRDDESAALFEHFYRELGAGRSIGEALVAAQRARREEGAPSAAWAGFVLIGDGDIVPYPREPGGWRPLAIGLALLAAFVVGLRPRGAA